MAVYSLWNNKGGVGKSYLTFQIACEYARTHPDKKVLVIDLCPQANSSGMLFGGMDRGGEEHLDNLCQGDPRRTIAGYIRGRISSAYHSPKNGASYLTQVSNLNHRVPSNLYLISGDEELEVLASRVSRATIPGADEAWAKVHLWIRDLIADVSEAWDVSISDVPVFIDCNPSFGIYTELALTSSDHLLIPFSADGSSRRAVRAVLSLVYGVMRAGSSEQSEFYNLTGRFRLRIPKIYMYIGNRLTQANYSSANAFRTVVREIGSEIYNVWLSNPNCFSIHPNGTPIPSSKRGFSRMFQYEVPDANTASVVSSSLGIPIVSLGAGRVNVAGRAITVNQSQLDKQQPAIRDLVSFIE